LFYPITTPGVTLASSHGEDLLTRSIHPLGHETRLESLWFDATSLTSRSRNGRIPSEESATKERMWTERNAEVVPIHSGEPTNAAVAAKAT
jgi:hypothetical protein